MSDISTDAMMREAAMMDASDNHVWARKVRRLCIERDKLQAQLAALPAASSHPLASDARRALEADDVHGWIKSLPAASAEDVRAGALKEAAENKEQLDIWAQEILEGLSMADVLKIESYEDKIEAHSVIGRGIVEVLRALIPEAKP